MAIVFFFILGHKVSIPIGCFAVCNISGGLFCILLFEFWRKYTFRKASVMYKLGAFSYETYLIHGLIMLAIRSNTLYIHSKWAFCLITVFFTLLLAYLFHMFLNIMFRKNGKKVRWYILSTIIPSPVFFTIFFKIVFDYCIYILLAHTLSIMLVMMIWKDSLNMLSDSSSVKKTKNPRMYD